jgi:regulatory protein
MTFRTIRKARNWTEESAFAKVVRLCNVRERSTGELARRLEDDGVPAALACKSIRRAEACGLVEDSRFADAFLRGKLALGWGRQRIERELARYGINLQRLPETLENYPDAYFSSESELNRAIAVLERHKSSARNLRDARYRRLAAKGFAPDVIRQAVAAREQCSSQAM